MAYRYNNDVFSSDARFDFLIVKLGLMIESLTSDSISELTQLRSKYLNEKDFRKAVVKLSNDKDFRYRFGYDISKIEEIYDILDCLGMYHSLNSLMDFGLDIMKSIKAFRMERGGLTVHKKALRNDRIRWYGTLPLDFFGIKYRDGRMWTEEEWSLVEKDAKNVLREIELSNIISDLIDKLQITDIGDKSSLINPDTELTELTEADENGNPIYY